MIDKKKLPIRELLVHLKERLEINLIAGKDGLNRSVSTPELNRPGLALSGFFETFSYDRIQIFGISESKFFKTLPAKEQEQILREFFSYEIPAIFFTTASEIKIPSLFKKYAQENAVPLFQTTLTTSQLVGRLYHYLEDFFAPEITLHGVLVDIFGVGTLIRGGSGIGKSECALQLVERGHRLVADDLVFIKKYQPEILVGKCSNINVHTMEIRGIGIFDVSQIFGWGRVRYQKKISLVVELVDADKFKIQEVNTGLKREKENILGVELERKIIPVKPGRNMALLVEVASLVFRQEQSGVSFPQQFNERLIKMMKENKKPGSIHNGW